MSIKLGKSELWKAIMGLGKVVPCKGPLPILACVRGRTVKNTVTMTGTNLDETLIYTFKDSVNSDDIDFIIRLDDLKKFIHNGIDGNIVFQYGENGMLETTMDVNGEVKCRVFKTEKPEDWPTNMPTVEKMDPVSGAVFNWIRSVIPSAASQKDSRRTLQSVYLEKTGMTATNGKELAHVECKLPIDGLIMPVTKVLTSRIFEHSGFLGTSLNAETKYLCINCDWFTYHVKCVDAKYPNYRHLVPKGDKARATAEIREDDVRNILNQLPLIPVKGDCETVILYAGKHGVHIFPEDGKTVLGTDGTSDSMTDHFVKVDRRNLERALMLWHTKLSFGGDSPVMAQGIFPGYFLFMPIKGEITDKEKLLSLVKDRTNPNKEENQMNARATVTAPQTATATAPQTTEQKPGFQVVGGRQENGEVFEEAASAVETLKASIKVIYDGVADLQRKLKDAQKAIKNKEREYQSTKHLITRLRTASGF